MYDRSELEAILAESLKGQSPRAYSTKAVKILNEFAGSPEAGNKWKLLGPWWPAVQRLIVKAYPDSGASQWNDGNPPPEYLEHYTYGDNADGMVLDAIAALTYLNRDGAYTKHPDDVHTISMLDGENRLYQPGQGLIDRH